MANYGISLVDSQGQAFSDQDLMTKILHRQIINQSTKIQLTQIITGNFRYWVSFIPSSANIYSGEVTLSLTATTLTINNPTKVAGTLLIGVY